MQDFLTLVGQIMLIVCIQLILEVLADTSKRPLMGNVIGMTSFVGCLYFLIQFIVRSNMLRQILIMFK